MKFYPIFLDEVCYLITGCLSWSVKMIKYKDETKEQLNPRRRHWNEKYDQVMDGESQ